MIAGRRRFRSVTLEVRPTNDEARTLYESFGFRVVGRRRGYYYDTGEDALIMESDLEVVRLLEAGALEEVASLVPDLLLDVDLARGETESRLSRGRR